MDHLENTRLALRLWNERVKPEMIVAELCAWWEPEANGCGSQACFGGHLATWPEFRAMGVDRMLTNQQSDLPVVDERGYPMHLHTGEPFINHVGEGYAVAEHLFGTSELFEPRRACMYDYRLLGDDNYDISDHQVVQHRLERHIEQLEKERAYGNQQVTP